jgi:tRNA U34 5-methylaminomethyl-2-thiouridine-forming methyltransferase MnmC
MRKVITRDGSETFVNSYFNESYHSFTGAVEEAMEKYCKPCKIASRAIKMGKIVLLDFAFGMGYNSAMAIAVAKSANPNCKVRVIGLENDSMIIDKISEMNPAIDGYAFYHGLNSKNLKVVNSDGSVSVEILLGDAKYMIKKISKESVDVIFYDAFSPKTQPEMWSVEYFVEVARILKEKGVLATYSCARMVRDNMLKAGLTYGDGPKVGRRGPGTLAWIEDEQEYEQE